MSVARVQSDKELCELLMNGDEHAYTVIYQRYWNSLFSSACKRLKDKDLAKDLIQVVLTDLWRRRKEVVIHDLSSYLHTAVRFQVFKYISRKPHSSPFLDEFELMLASPMQADDTLLERETASLLRLWISALPSKRRTIFLLYAEEELSTRQIAEKLGITQKTVQNQLHTAITHLRLRLIKGLAVASIAILSEI
jgi:RNA polymerase sigma factor (sigma-70 family)